MTSRKSRDSISSAWKYIEGRTLDKLLKERGRLGADEALRIVAQAALALEHAHNNRIIHRDIKPSNIILDGYGNVKVMDFGLARITGERSRLTQSGTLMGTLDYMSPEQCRGEELDAQTDIYSLGVVLYEMLAGKLPFDAPNEAALINRILHDDPPELTTLEPEVSRDLAHIVTRAMSRNKDGRYATIAEFLEDIRRLESISSSSAGEAKSSPSIAVLPFVNMSADPDQEYFCDGLSEELINALTQIEDLHVIARTSAFRSRAGTSTSATSAGNWMSRRYWKAACERRATGSADSGNTSFILHIRTENVTARA